MSKKRLEYWKIGFIWLTSTLALSACDSPLVKTAPNTTAEVITDNNAPKNSMKDAALSIQCPPFNADNTVCTAQYDPVCTTVKEGLKVSYHTSGNACSACSSPAAVSYVLG